MRLLTRHGWGTTAGVVLLVAAALAVIIGTVGVLASRDREIAAQQGFARVVVDRTASLADVLETLAPEARQPIVQRLHNPRYRLWLAPDAPPTGKPWQHSEEIEEAARDAAPIERLADMMVRALDGLPPPYQHHETAAPIAPEDWNPGFYSLLVAFPLADGQWVVAVAPARPLAAPPGSFALIVLGLAVLATVVVAFVVAHIMTRPLRTLAGAADRLSTDLDAPPLEARGSREMRRAAAAFNVMQERLKRMVDDRTLMVAAMSHDLRTIITRLRLRAEEIGDETQRDKAIEDLDDMETMVAEALDAARGEAAREERRAVDLAAMLQSLVDDHTDAGRDATYRGPERLVAQGRPVALRRAVANLIDNALRYGGAAEVMLERSEGSARIAVADRGPGIPDGRKETMFRPFMRGEPSRNRATGGTGLGLAVARSILRAHGGDITLADRPGGGLVVTAELPL